MKKLLYCHLAVLLLPLAALAGAVTNFDFFFHVHLWPASHCNAGGADCCYVPVNNKPPADFFIHGMWPNYASCQRGLVPPVVYCSPGFCNATDSLNPSRVISSLRKTLYSSRLHAAHHQSIPFADQGRALIDNWGSLSCENRNPVNYWSDEWNEHGTCSNMDQHSYFRAALDFKARFNLTRILLRAGIVPSNENIYELSRIRDAVTEATGSAPNVECNQNEEGEIQLYLVHQCVGWRPPAPTRSSSQSSKSMMIIMDSV
ncbi:hypothetical protein EJB05_13687 [Eragrostis curvula]|uniref:Uncharacterized protein n=1 Tax=Eragrostis curvula TaxID=38414 RepID=A0A5J9VY08_9POAL|nr:hypothetical protein EJB05_13687 [Eragrostis curvula]